jgi:choline dehydrogenase-like flavoprotein
MLSGIGAKAELAAAKIPMIVNLPSVGKNMSDHVLLGNPFTAMNLSDWIGEHLAPDHVNQDIATWLATKGGPLAGGTSNEIGYLRLPTSDATLKKYGDPSTGLTSGHYEMTFTVSPRDSHMRCGISSFPSPSSSTRPTRRRWIAPSCPLARTWSHRQAVAPSV